MTVRRKNRLAQWMRSAGITSEQLAKHMGVTISTVSQWRTGLRTPRESRMKKLALALRLPPGTIQREMRG